MLGAASPHASRLVHQRLQVTRRETIGKYCATVAKRKQVITVTFLVKEQNVSVISIDVHVGGIS